MTHPLIEITEDEFDACYPLQRNHLNPHASWGFDDGAGCLFETIPLKVGANVCILSA
jgi:hypothetical protein